MSTAGIQLLAVRSQAHDLLRDLEAVERFIGRSVDEEIVYSALKKAIDDCLSNLKTLKIWGPQNRLLSSELWNVAGHLLQRSWLQNQARTKPRGYAGDHELLGRIYQRQLGDDALGRLFDRYFQEQAAPQAVRNRMAMAANWIVEAASHSGHSPLTTHHTVHITVVGSAFGLEIRDALLRLDDAARQRCLLTLLDLDPAAIDFASSHLAPLVVPNRLTTISTNLFRLPDRPQVLATIPQADLIYCPGLFDYLDDAQARSMLRCLYRQTRPGGRLMVFQFAPHNPTRAYMEWFANWYLTYRDELQFRDLIDSTALPGAELVFDAEPLGIDRCCQITSSAG